MQYTITPHPKGAVIRTNPDGNGWKSPASVLAEALAGKWSNRSNGYLLSSKAATDFQRLASNGWKATRLWITGQKADFYHSEHGTKSRKEALQLCQP